MCPSVCLSVCFHVAGTVNPNFTKCSVHASCGCGLFFLLALLRYVNHFRFGDDIILPTVAKAKATQVEHPASTHVDSPECSTDLTPRRIGNERVPKIMITQ